MNRQRRTNRWVDATWMIALGGLLSLHFWFPEFGSNIQNDTFSTTRHGKKAFYFLAQEQAPLVGRNTDPLTRYTVDADEYQTLCILGPARWPTEDEWRTILEWVELGGTLVIAPHFEAGDLVIPMLNVEFNKSGSFIEVNSSLKGESERIDTLLGVDAEILWDSAHTISAPAARTLVEVDNQMQAGLQDYGYGKIVLVASEFVFSNEAIDWSDNAPLAWRLLESGDNLGLITFDESLNISGTPRVVSLMLDYALRPVTVQILLVLLLFAWWESRRFGGVKPEMVKARHNIVDHTDAVGNLHYRSRDGTFALKSYLRQLHLELKMRMFKGKENRVLDPIAIRLKRKPEQIRKLMLHASRTARSEKVDRQTASHLIYQLSFIRQAHHRKPGRKISGTKPDDSAGRSR